MTTQVEHMNPVPSRAMPNTMMHAATRTMLTCATALAAAACSSALTDPAQVPPTPPITALPRSLSAGEQKLVSATNDFSFDLFRQISSSQKDVNVFSSPLSASMALGMTMNGAANGTLDQMRATLRFANITDSEINESYKSLIALLRGLDNTVDFRVANSIWYRTGFPVNQPFLDAVRTSFGAQVTALDFSSPTAPKAINDWVSSATAGKIPSIVDKLGDEVMILVNAIYFKGSWRQKFDPAETKDAVFRGTVGDQPMKLMHRKGSVTAAFRSDYSVVDLPYGDSVYTMTVIVPGNGVSVDAVAASLDGSAWTTMLSQMRAINIDVFIPKLKLEWERKLNADLSTLGMRDAFLPSAANFSRLSPVATYIDYVKQKTYVDINEEGTQAAAVTSVGITPVSLPPQLRADRPFIVVIRERLSGTILFMGKIARMP